MKRLLLLAALVIPVPPLDAQVIYRCRAADGTSVFADRPCEAMDAQPIAPAEAIDDSDPAALAGVAASPLARPAAAGGCPGPDPVTLLKRVQEAFAARDINALAGMYDWTGSSHRAASRVLVELEALIASRPASIRLEDAYGWQWQPTHDPQQRFLPRLQIYADAAAQQPRAGFRLVRNAGCVWLAD
jgi:hypothetical protein